MITDRAKTYLTANRLYALFWVLTVTAIAWRYLPYFANFISCDLVYCIRPWIDRMRRCDMSEAISVWFTNYAPLYPLLLVLISLLPAGTDVFFVKLYSILGDIALACVVAAIVRTVTPRPDAGTRNWRPIAAAALVLWLPTVFINSAMWGQCDVMWTTCCLLSLLYFIKGRSDAAMIWYGVAFSFKLQSFFFSPVIFLLLLARKVSWWKVLYVPAMYVLTCLPSAIIGRRPWDDLLTIYFVQYEDSRLWSANCPSLYYFIRDLKFNPDIALIIDLLLVAITIVICLRLLRTYRQSDAAGQIRILLIFTAFCGVFYPFFLPQMHERYFYLGVVASALAASVLLTDRRMWTAFFLTEAGSALGVFGIITWRHFRCPGWMETAAVLMTLAVIAIILRLLPLLRRPLHKDSQQPIPPGRKAK